jgi:hypothetical protein
METQQRFSSSENANDLLQFTGTEEYYKNGNMPHILYTDGVKHLFETRSCYWLGNLIAGLHLFNKAIRQQGFVSCEFTAQSSEGMLILTDGNDNILHEEKILFTDFTDKGVCLWLIDGVLLLPSEY